VHRIGIEVIFFKVDKGSLNGTCVFNLDDPEIIFRYQPGSFGLIDTHLFLVFVSPGCSFR